MDTNRHMPLTVPVASLLDSFHGEKPLRVWSLIITLYGDAIVPRGGSLWLGALTEMMELFGIDSGHVRTAMSRLTTDGWLTRLRVGRNSYYQLSKRGIGSFGAATRRIYFADKPAFDGRLHVALLGADINARSATRTALAGAGFVPLTSTSSIALAAPSPDVMALDNVFFLAVEPSDETRRMAAAAWKLADIARAYRAFIARFAILADAADAPDKLDGPDALVARILLIHAFRRIVLRDPDLPEQLLPRDWPQAGARKMAADLYRRLVPASEAWLSAHASNEEGPLPPPEADFAFRFEQQKTI